MNSIVHFKSVPSYDPALLEGAMEELFAALPATERLNGDSHVLLKPNLLAKHPPEHAVTTHPEVLRAVIRACKKRGVPAEQIIVADSAGGLYNPNQMRSLYAVCGLTAVCECEGVQLYTDCDTVVCKTLNGVVVTEFELLKPFTEVDFIINLPKLKTHVMTGMTVACKNLFGAVPGLKKSEFHMRFPDKERFGEMLIDLLELLKPDVHIMDGILAMEGDGPAGGVPRQVGLMMASENPLQLDLAVAQLMQLDPMEVPYLKAAHRRQLCAKHFNPALATGDVDRLSPIPGWVLPKSYQKGGEGSVDFVKQIPKLFRPIASKLTHAVAPHPVITKSLCIGCGKCKEICSRDAISIQNGKATIHQSQCIRCFCCHEVCPVKAIDVKTNRFFSH